MSSSLPGDGTATPAPMEPLLKLVNKLQETCALAGDVGDVSSPGQKTSSFPSLWETLPQIVVVGGQSSGKSSVLESIVGRDFLPRGSGICTRRPLVLQLHGCEPGEVACAKFLHKPKVVFTDFSEVRKEIETETTRSLADKGSKAVSADPIMLSIKAPGAPSLTLVDMPGLTKVATKDQPACTVADIEQMAKKFITSKNVVIVAVSAANADIATSDGIRIAKECDPHFQRTLGILTKLDLMDKGRYWGFHQIPPHGLRILVLLTKGLLPLSIVVQSTDATEVLSGKTVGLNLGWCAVVNRSQSDISSGVGMPAARDAERRWFDSHKETYGADTHNVGTDVLCKMLVDILGAAVRFQSTPRGFPKSDARLPRPARDVHTRFIQRKYGNTVPKIQESVERSARALEVELNSLGRHSLNASAFEDRGALVHEVLRGCDLFEQDFVSELDSQRDDGAKTGGGGETIRRLFEETLVTNLKRVDLHKFYDLKRVKSVVDASDGYQPHLVAPEMGIRKLIELGLRTLHEPVLTCVDGVDRVLQQAMRLSAATKRRSSSSGKSPMNPNESTINSRSSNATLRRFPELRAAVTNGASDALHKLKVETIEMTSDMVDMEASYFDADFFREIQSAEQAKLAESSRKNGGGVTSNERERTQNSSSELSGDHLLDADRDASVTASGGALRSHPFQTRFENPEFGNDARLSLIASCVRVYVEAVRGRLAKTVPKAVVHRLVLRARKGICREFVATVGRRDDGELKLWMKEDPAVVKRRDAITKRLTLLDKARDEIAQVVGEYR